MTAKLNNQCFYHIGIKPNMLLPVCLLMVITILADTAYAASNLLQLPGGIVLPEKISKQLSAVAHQHQSNPSLPRSQKTENAPNFINRLLLENSPYLQQHANNPINWYPWGNEAFAKAVRENKPIFLSIGYSTCHWCHVMRHESFSNIEIAKWLNRHFIAIKVDRERRPQVDQLYMSAVQLISGQGGWPISLFLNSQGKPFYGGTYFSQETFLDLLQTIAKLWAEDQAALITQADMITLAISKTTEQQGTLAIAHKTQTQAVAELLAMFDPYYGGFGESIKFPHAIWLLFLLDQHYRHGDAKIATVVEKTLDAMGQGGIYDHIGGGFYRYSTDPRWQIPHFEKMLYDQALLSSVYFKAYVLTGKLHYRRVMQQTLEFVLRELAAAGGGFYAATDADSADGEGAFYVWTSAEIKKILGADSDIFIDAFGITETGNFAGKNLPFLPQPLAVFAKQHEIPLKKLLSNLDKSRNSLRLQRMQRPLPFRDKKIITAWNGMMISILAQTAWYLKDSRLAAAATTSANFIWQKCRDANGKLLRIFFNDVASIPAQLDDHAHFAQALIDLYDLTGNRLWLSRSRYIADEMIAQFWDSLNGGFFFNPKPGNVALLAQPRNLMDGDIPSANAVAARMLNQLSLRTGEERYRNKAKQALAIFSPEFMKRPTTFIYSVLAASELLTSSTGLIQYGARGGLRVSAMLKPNKNDTNMYHLDVELFIQKGWHINANMPLQKDLVPTNILIPEGNATLIKVKYPQPQQLTMAFSSVPMALYQDQVNIQADIEWRNPDNNHRILPVQVNFQACSRTSCLPPATIRLYPPITAAP